MNAVPAGPAAGPAAAGGDPRAYFPALDGLRCIAFLLVFSKHAFPKSVPVLGAVAWNGWCGVDVFFTLSGFLVTYLLLAEERRRAAAGEPGRFSVLRFWARRCLRIWPLYFLILLASFVLIPLLPAPWCGTTPWGSEEHRNLVDWFAAPSAVFMLNWPVMTHNWPYGPLGPLWSVSIEEQFYVAWPLVLFLVPQRARWAATWIVIAIAATTKILVGGGGYLAVYVNSLARADAFLAGAVVAQVMIARRTLPAPPRWVAVALAAGAVALFSLPPLATRTPTTAWFGYLLLDVLAAGLVWQCLSPGTVVHRVLALPPFVWMGKVSYGLYCFHVIAIGVADVLLDGMRVGGHTGAFFASRIVLSLGLTIALAALSWATYESWFLRLKHRFA